MDTKQSKLKKLTLNRGWTIAALILLSAWIALLTLYFQPGSFLHELGIFYHQPLLIVLNGLPALLVTVCLYFAFGNVFSAAAVSCALLNGLAIANRMKIEARDDPLVPRDISLLREALAATTGFDVEYSVTVFALYLGSLVLFILAAVFIASYRPKWKGRLLGVVLSAAILCGATATVYADQELYENFEVSSQYNITTVFNELGFSYCFLHNVSLYPIEKPDNYSEAAARAWAQDPAQDEAAAPTVRPHVIFLMCESFYDLTLNEHFQFSAADDPLRYYKELCAGDHAISGHIVVSNFGAGTANTEFDVQTGMQTNMISSDATSAFRVLRKPMRSLASLLAEDEYASFFIHPGQSWFYNRSSVYQFLGIDDQIFADDFAEDTFKGITRSDAAFFDMLAATFADRAAAGAPLFAYTVSIQNHMSYTYDKYPGLTIPDVPLDIEVSDEAMEYLSVFTEGLRDGDLLLKNTTDYFAALDEPVILVFFGDHLPALGENYLSYRELGIDVGSTEASAAFFNTYKAPFLIWANDTAADALDFEQAAAALELGEEPVISDNYLGALTLELIGADKQDNYFAFLNEARRQLPVIWRGQYLDADGAYTTELTAEQQAIVDKMQNWEYYKLKKE